MAAGNVYKVIQEDSVECQRVFLDLFIVSSVTKQPSIQSAACLQTAWRVYCTWMALCYVFTRVFVWMEIISVLKRSIISLKVTVCFTCSPVAVTPGGQNQEGRQQMRLNMMRIKVSNNYCMRENVCPESCQKDFHQQSNNKDNNSRESTLMMFFSFVVIERPG